MACLVTRLVPLARLFPSVHVFEAPSFSTIMHTSTSRDDWMRQFVTSGHTDACRLAVPPPRSGGSPPKKLVCASPLASTSRMRASCIHQTYQAPHHTAIAIRTASCHVPRLTSLGYLCHGHAAQHRMLHTEYNTRAHYRQRHRSHMLCLSQNGRMHLVHGPF